MKRYLPKPEIRKDFGFSAVFYQKKLDQLESKARHRAKDLRAAALALRIAAERYRILEEVIF